MSVIQFISTPYSLVKSLIELRRSGLEMMERIQEAHREMIEEQVVPGTLYPRRAEEPQEASTLGRILIGRSFGFTGGGTRVHILAQSIPGRGTFLCKRKRKAKEPLFSNHIHVAGLELCRDCVRHAAEGEV